MADPIADKFGMTPMQEILPPMKDGDEARALVPSGSRLDEDYEFARENIRAAIDKISDAVDTFSEIAIGSQHPRAFEVLNQMLANMVASSKDLFEMSRKRSELGGAEPQTDAPHVVNNTLVVGSTADIQRILNEIRDGKAD